VAVVFEVGVVGDFDVVLLEYAHDLQALFEPVFVGALDQAVCGASQVIHPGSTGCRFLHEDATVFSEHKGLLVAVNVQITH
jgi:hypothetical protein